MLPRVNHFQRGHRNPPALLASFVYRSRLLLLPVRVPVPPHKVLLLTFICRPVAVCSHPLPALHTDFSRVPVSSLVSRVSWGCLEVHHPSTQSFDAQDCGCKWTSPSPHLHHATHETQSHKCIGTDNSAKPSSEPSFVPLSNYQPVTSETRAHRPHRLDRDQATHCSSLSCLEFLSHISQTPGPPLASLLLCPNAWMPSHKA